MSEPGRHGARCFGTDWRSDLPLEHFDPAALPVGDCVSVNRVNELPDRPLRQASPRMQLAPDGFRFRWDEEATFDAHADGSIAVLPGPAWPDAMPVAFYSTVAATMLAWRGLVPMHMSSVVIDDRAWLIGGCGGAGKSTLTAELIAAGAQFLSDDLSVLRIDQGTPLVTRGRPAIRLYPSAAAMIDCSEVLPQPEDVRGKLLVRPEDRAPDRDFPIGGFLILDDEHPDGVKQLGRSLFRPRIISRSPAGMQIAQRIAAIAETHRILCAPALQLPDPAQRQQRLHRILALINGPAES